MHLEGRAIEYPIEQASKFDVIQDDNDRLDSMEDAKRVAKTTLRHFNLTIQDECVLLQQLESIIET
jgi:hypothetical protein